jgi:CRP-like cAMP-binding protein
MERLATLVTCEMDETIYHCDEPARYWYRMVSGSARKCSLSTDGRRQIVDFLLPDDVFGFGADDFHHFSTESVVSETTIARYPRHRVLELAESEAPVSRWICEKAFKSIARLQARTLILGHTSALARVSAFLLEWEDRCEQESGSAISLPMSRYDIADYLAIAVETVSRAFTVLRTRQVIAFLSTRRLTISDRQALRLATEGADFESVAN